MLILIRHADVVVDPHAPSETWVLTADGVARAAALAKHHAFADVILVATSPERKALATATAIAGERPIVVAEGLRELDRRAVGWVGSAEEYADLVQSILERPTESVRGCESAEHASRRIVRAIDDLLAANPRHSLAVVSHGIVLTLYLSTLLGLAAPDLAIWRGIALPDLAVVDPIESRVVVGFGGPGHSGN